MSQLDLILHASLNHATLKQQSQHKYKTTAENCLGNQNQKSIWYSDKMIVLNSLCHLHGLCSSADSEISSNM